MRTKRLKCGVNDLSGQIGQRYLWYTWVEKMCPRLVLQFPQVSSHSKPYKKSKRIIDGCTHLIVDTHIQP